VDLIATGPGLVGDRQRARVARPMKRRIAFSVFSRRLTSGVPPVAGRAPATSEFLWTSKTIHRLTTAGATELTSGMGWSSFVCGSGRSGR
jgi:hypothetical protein